MKRFYGPTKKEKEAKEMAFQKANSDLDLADALVKAEYNNFKTKLKKIEVEITVARRNMLEIFPHLNTSQEFFEEHGAVVRSNQESRRK